MNTLLIVFAIICAIVGIIGSIAPVLPGPPLSFIALLLMFFTSDSEISLTTLIVMGVIALVITVLDFFIPVLGTKHFGGTKSGSRGSTIGLVVSVFVLPLLGITLGPFGLIGILAGPFVGAYLGELHGGAHKQQALKAAIGSFIGFLVGTLMKLVYGIIVLVYVFIDIF